MVHTEIINDCFLFDKNREQQLPSQNARESSQDKMVNDHYSKAKMFLMYAIKEYRFSDSYGIETNKSSFKSNNLNRVSSFLATHTRTEL